MSEREGHYVVVAGGLPARDVAGIASRIARDKDVVVVDGVDLTQEVMAHQQRRCTLPSALTMAAMMGGGLPGGLFRGPDQRKTTTRDHSAENLRLAEEKRQRRRERQQKR